MSNCKKRSLFHKNALKFDIDGFVEDNVLYLFNEITFLP